MTNIVIDRAPKSLRLIAALLGLCVSLRAAEPAAVEKILGKDVNGWVEHLKHYENETERKKAMLCLMTFGPYYYL
jgi:hypothetical protein